MKTLVGVGVVESNSDSQAMQASNEKLLVSSTEAGRMLGLTSKQLWRFYHSGKAPGPVCLGRKAMRWRVDELRAWVRAGCPDVTTWATIKAAVAA